MKKYVSYLAILACCLLGGLEGAAQSFRTADGEYYDIGKIHLSVSSESEVAQKWFDRGLAMCYGFNHEEAVLCFERALQADPGLAMGHWGMAYAWGPNINNMLIASDQIAKADHAVHLAKLYADDAKPLEKDLIEALGARYTAPVPEEREGLNRSYAEAMRKLHKKHKDSPLVAALFAESLMNLQPWKHWSPAGEPGAETQEIVQVLEQAMARWPDYPALSHLYIHTMEASPTPEKALPAANRLRNAVPGSGHLIHMPSHIDVLVGAYDDVIEANTRAIEVDDDYARREGPFNFYTLYRIHNYHFLVYGAMFDGQSELALATARKLVEQVPEEMLKQQVDFIDAFIPTSLHVLVRFGRWEEILQEPEPAEYLPVTRSVWHYARALAYAATGRVAEAEEERDLFKEVRATVPDTSFLFQNASQNILEVAEQMIEGEIAYRQGDFDKAFEYLREAVRHDDSLNYDEPWGWMQPARHALGALMMEQGHFEESEAVYRADLKRHPKNPWALHGLAEALRGQGKAEEAAECQLRFMAASKRTDVKIDRSCYCRLQDEEEAAKK